MSLYIASLNSGSNGNCYYVGNGKNAVLIDAGISCREIEKRIRQLGLSVFNIKAVFISHEHIDHIKGVEVLSKRYDIPVYITAKTLQNSHLNIGDNLLREFVADEAVEIEGMSVVAFSKHHDAAEPHSFTVCGNGVTIGVFTDIGRTCDNLIRHFKQCHAAFLEANYDEVMLEQGRYPYHLKNRIRGGYGHLSNTQALELFQMHKPAHMSHLLLAHLSKENNDPQLVSDVFKAHANNVEIIVASRYEESALLHISSSRDERVYQPNIKMKQASLF